MIESLRNNLVQACDNEKITLHCPRNTHILIQNAFYGRLVPSNQLCPQKKTTTLTTTTTKQNQQKLKRIHHQQQNFEDTSCDVAEAHQVFKIFKLKILICFETIFQAHWIFFR